MTLLLHGIVCAEHPAAAGLQAVVADGLAVIVSDIGAAELTEEHARSHLDVLCGLLSYGPVLPLRFGSTAPDEESVRDNALRPDQAALRAELERVAGLVEVRVHLTFDQNEVLGALVEQDPGLATPVQGFDAAVEQGRRIEARAKDWMTERSRELFDGLAVDMVRLPDPDSDSQRWALLVRADDLDRMADALDALSGVVTAGVLGPLPPYNFVSLPVRPVSRWGFG
ncbi:GvpL/GvpF family gas vesicle protein [Kutzneria sp. NPDC052558]|uniref:GvpL/GvpF family gas vesicle protein n=1 Tax=Kutzneria sp. NPDC052558 TaxID=3364121 RepID=UPI0037C5F4EA